MILLFLLFIIPLSAQQLSIDDLKWLQGEWEYTSSNNIYFNEKWEYVNDSLMMGESVALKGNDTLTYETVRLFKHDDKIIYAPTVKGQNNNREVQFTLVEYDSSFVFENKDHDFPQKISYFRKDNMLYASIQGESNGNLKTINFNFVLKEDIFKEE
jgi:hypothetical protein